MVKRYDCTSGGAQFCQGCYTMEEESDRVDGNWVRAEDYDALAAELAECRKNNFDAAVLILEKRALESALRKIVRDGDYTAPEGMKRIAQEALASELETKGESCSDARPQGQEDPVERTHPKATDQVGTVRVSGADKQPISPTTLNR